MKRYRSQVVVVGTGAGGAVAAAILAGAGVDTLIVEQGRTYAPEEHGDVIDAFAHMYLRGAMTVALGNPPIPIPLGCAVGGTTVINSSTCFRPPREKVEQWKGPNWDTLEPCLDAVETRSGVAEAEVALLGGNYTVLKRGCDALGVPIRPLRHNLRNCQGSGRCAFGCPTGAKQSTDRTFIVDALAAGARLCERHQMTGLLRRGGRISGVTGLCLDSGEPFEAQAEAVILALGALTTPAFLLRQRLGGIKVGHGLRIHPACRVAALFDETIDGHVGLPQGAFIDTYADKGVMLEGISLPPGPLLSALPGAGERFESLADQWRCVATFGVMVSDHGAGRVHRGLGNSPFTARYSLHQRDAEAMQFGLARLAELYFAAGARRVFTNAMPVPVLESMDDLRAFEKARATPGGFELMAFHPTGTCAMSDSPASGVVDASLKVHDTDGLYIMDGSIIPDALGVNPQITIMALARHGALRLAKTLGASSRSDT